jgi:hypothetical protein
MTLLGSASFSAQPSSIACPRNTTIKNCSTCSAQQSRAATPNRILLALHDFSRKYLRGRFCLQGFTVAFWICAGLRGEIRDAAEKFGEEIS